MVDLMNNRGVLGNLISLMILIGVGIMIFGYLNEMMDSVEEGCLNGTLNDSDFCYIFQGEEEESLKTLWDLIPYFFIATMLLIGGGVGWNILKSIFRSFDFNVTSFDEEEDEEDEDEKEKYLKETEDKLRKELTRNKLSSDMKLKPINPKPKPKENKGIDWGEGMDHYAKKKEINKDGKS